MSDKKTVAAAQRIRESITGREPKSFAPVVIGDVGKVIAAIPQAKRDEAEWINDLAVGVRNNPPEANVWQTSGHLAELLEVFDSLHPEPADAAAG